MPASTRALWFVGPRQVELRDEPLRAPGPRDVVVRALASGVSQGTEMLLYKGEGPEVFDPSLDGPSSDGASRGTYPRRYGYAWVGEVVARGIDARLHEGTRVFALAPHGDAHVLDGDAVRALPEDFSATRAVLAANLETAVTCAWDASPSLGDDVVVLGGGVVGILTAWLLAKSGATVTLIERSERRRAAARALVPSAMIESDAVPDGAADIVIEATGDPRMLDAAVAWTRSEGRIVVASFYGARRAPIDLGDAFHRRRLQLQASQVSSIPPRLRERWTPARRWLFVLSLLHDRALDALIAPPTPFANAAELYASLAADADVPPAHVFVYR
ncbi:MAG: Threonine dehydrogenase [Myxococcaceae bacterium]|nr:Threonine dehydrogenase [Myxococcaceae bacterium]